MLSIEKILEFEEALKEELKTKKFPLTEEGSTTQLPDGRKLGYHKYGYQGPLDPSRVVLFFHGTPGSRFFMTGEMEEILVSNRVVMYILERPGFGLSSPQPSRSFKSWTEDVSHFIDAVASKEYNTAVCGISVIGYSAGGPYAAACARFLPEKLACVTIVSSPSPPENPEATKGMDLTSKIGYFLARHWKWGLEKIGVQSEAKKWFNDPLKNTKEFLTSNSGIGLGDAKTFILQPSIERAFAISAKEMYSNLKQAVETETNDYWLFCHHWGFSLSDIPQDFPVYVWYGLEDTSTVPSMSEFMVSQIPKGLPHAIDFQGHLTFFSHFDQIIAEIVSNPCASSSSSSYSSSSSSSSSS